MQGWCRVLVVVAAIGSVSTTAAVLGAPVEDGKAAFARREDTMKADGPAALPRHRPRGERHCPLRPGYGHCGRNRRFAGEQSRPDIVRAGLERRGQQDQAGDLRRRRPSRSADRRGAGSCWTARLQCLSYGIPQGGVMRGLRLAPFGAALVLSTLTQADLAAGEEDQVERGQYLVRAGGCFSCHTAKGGEKLAGGRPLTTPFGTFYSPNITPDPDTGIGRWADAQFLRALRDGVRPDCANYFPVFPYPSFTGITDSNALAMKAYLFSLPPVHQQNRPHDVPFPISLRWLQTGWS